MLVAPSLLLKFSAGLGCHYDQLLHEDAYVNNLLKAQINLPLSAMHADGKDCGAFTMP